MRLSHAVLATALVTGVATATAAPYEAYIDVESEEDLNDLLATGTISADTHAVLIELLSRGVDLDRASRAELYSLPNLTYDEVDAILAYRQVQGFVADPADLVAAGALTEQKLLAIAAFLILPERGPQRLRAPRLGPDPAPRRPGRRRPAAGRGARAGQARPAHHPRRGRDRHPATPGRGPLGPPTATRSWPTRAASSSTRPRPSRATRAIASTSSPAPTASASPSA
jgi:hypothetical protein